MNNRGLVKPGGGLCIYYKNCYTCSLFNDCTKCTPDLESLAIGLVRPNHNLIIVLSIYRPPDGSLSECFKLLREMFIVLSAVHRRAELFVVGNINLDISIKSPKTEEFFDLCNQFGLCNYVYSPTRFTSSTATTIDICLTNSQFISNCGTVAYAISDHLPVRCIKKKKMCTHPCEKVLGHLRIMIITYLHGVFLNLIGEDSTQLPMLKLVWPSYSIKYIYIVIIMPHSDHILFIKKSQLGFLRLFGLPL